MPKLSVEDRCIVIGEEGIKKENFLLPPHYEPMVDRILIPRGLLQDRMEKLAFDIYNKYQGKELHVVCILKGGRNPYSLILEGLNKIHKFNPDRNRTTAIKFQEHYVRIKSYHNTKSERVEVKATKEDLQELADKHVLLVDDIIDTGKTMLKFISFLNNEVKPKSIDIACMLHKRTPLSKGLEGDFIGFSIPDEFVIGFGMDYNEVEWFRDLEHLCVISEEGKRAFKK
eukprot:GHVU01209404.1.p1 GENE.GHVU01209404.1~~GHVU01209404.1.p1  ORF type:complete len:228 (-),score=51.11 GHVU01209404.1:1-684(-)